MNINEKNIIYESFSVKDALTILDKIGLASSVLFVVNEKLELLGTVTDGDIRRGLLRNVYINDSIINVANLNCKKLLKDEVTAKKIEELKASGIMYVPIVDEKNIIIEILNLNIYREIIPVDAFILAGGKGERLRPLTLEVPKPLLTVGSKPILELNIDRLIQFGITNIQISINYLGEKIEEYFGNGHSKGISINYIKESQPLGTIGSIAHSKHFYNDVVLIMNSDLLTNINFVDFYNNFINSGADMGVATIPHNVDLPYAILEFKDSHVSALKEKPRYTYFANAGIYLMKRSLIEVVPKNCFYNATDLMEKVISSGLSLIHYPILGYWLDIGRMSDYEKAQEDIKHISF